jgi:DNA-binding NtrC family response regulator
MSRARVLMVDDEASLNKVVCHFLEPYSIDVVVADTTASALKRLSEERFHAVICDFVMEDGGGLDVLRYVRTHHPQTPVLIITGYADEETAEKCFASGAFDFISKPIDRLSLIAVLRRALLRSGLIFEDEPTRPAHKLAQQFPHLVGASKPMKDIFGQIAKVAETDANVCIYGESGTGKEVVARAIHYFSRRAKRPLIVFDCAAIPEGLMESEMFGHVKGSFTSAISDRDGVFQLADGGTLLLDEVGELSLPLQAKLLRVIQCREFRKVGGKHPIKVDVRLVAATNKDLGAMIASGGFREDLYYRLEVIPLMIPPLRERKEDIPLLADHFIQKFNRNNRKQIQGLTSRTMGVLLRYQWPGNVRELENCIERAAVMTDGSLLDLPDLSQVLRTRSNAAPPPPTFEGWPRSLKEAERELILRTLQGVQGNRTRAAELLGISLRGLHYKLKELQEAGLLPPPSNGNQNQDGTKGANA